MAERSTTYMGKLIANQLSKGDTYRKLKKSILINILNFNYYKRNSYHSIAHMKFEPTAEETYVDMGYTKEDEIATKDVEMHFIEIPKFKKKNPDANAKLEQWLQLLVGEEEKIKMAEEKNRKVKKAVEVLDEMSMSREERERHEAILKAEGEKKSAILLAEGEKESAILRAEAIKETAIREAEGEAQAILAVQTAIAEGIRKINEAKPSDAYVAIKALESFEKAADGKATKIIIPSKIQELAGLATSIKELMSDEK